MRAAEKRSLMPSLGLLAWAAISVGGCASNVLRCPDGRVLQADQCVITDGAATDATDVHVDTDVTNDGATDVLDVVIPDGAECANGRTRPCPGAMGRCAMGIETCTNNRWGTCSITGTAETCNNIDDNCNGTVDEGFARISCYPDPDDDGFGVTVVGTSVCPDDSRPTRGNCPMGFTNRAPMDRNSTDCVENNPNAYPGAPAICAIPAVDHNCNGMADEQTPIMCFPDADNDGAGAMGSTLVAVCGDAMGRCPRGFASTNFDCCDTDNRAVPGATMFYGTPRMDCGGYDFDCDRNDTLEDSRVANFSCRSLGGFTACLAGATGSLSIGWLGGLPPACGSTARYLRGCEWSGGTCIDLIDEMRVANCN